MLIGEKYDYNILAAQYDFKNYIVFKCKLPYQNLLDMDIYKAKRTFELSERLALPKRERQVIYALSRNCIKDQAIPSKGLIFNYNVSQEKYSFFTTDIDILVECFEDEHNVILQLYKEESEYHDLSILIQTTLSFFAHKYNEVVGGSDFFLPFAGECGAFFSYYIVNNMINEIYKLKTGLIIPSITLVDKPHHQYDNLHTEIDKPFLIWKYYFNKAKYSYYVYDNLDCILSTAISLESYLNYLIDINKLRAKYEEHRIQQQKKSKSSKGFFFTLKFLFNEDKISLQEKELISTTYNKIAKFRNDIVHGNIYSPIQDRKNSTIAYEAVVDLYKNIERIDKIETQEFYSRNEPRYSKANMNFKKAKQYIEQKRYEDAKKIYQEIMREGFFKLVCTFKLGECHKGLGEYEEAEQNFTKCIEENYSLINALYLRAECRFLSGKYDSALLDYKELVKRDPDEEINYKRLGYIYINLHQYQNAIQSYRQLLCLSKSEGVYFACLGLAYNYNNQRDQALQILDEGLSLFPNHKDILKIRCDVYIDYYIYEKKHQNEVLQCVNNQILTSKNSEYYIRIKELIEKNLDNA